MEAEKKLKMLTMRAEGASIREIAKELGCSFQYIHQELEALCSPRLRNGIRTNCAFPNICDWMRKNKVSVRKLSKDLGVCYATMRNKLNGEVSQFTISEIKELVKITGMSFEEAFATDQE